MHVCVADRILCHLDKGTLGPAANAGSTVATGSTQCNPAVGTEDHAHLISIPVPHQGYTSVPMPHICLQQYKLEHRLIMVKDTKSETSLICQEFEALLLQLYTPPT